MILFKWFVEVIGFSRTEAKGASVLLVIVVVTAVLPKVYFQTTEDRLAISEQERQELLKWGESIEAKITYAEAQKPERKSEKNTYKKPPDYAKLSHFDPNTVSEEQLTKMGLSTYLANNMTKFVKAGGSFSKKEDLLKIYGMSEARYDKIAPFVSIPTRDNSPMVSTAKHKGDLNTASSEELKKIKGIGDKLSYRIVDYRNRLGGFYDFKQLEEIYYLDTSVIQRVEQEFLLNDSLIQISINTDSIRHLSTHPYMSYKLARAIVNYRKTHGDYQSLEQLMSIKILTDSIFQKLLPYLTLKQ